MNRSAPALSPPGPVAALAALRLDLLDLHRRCNALERSPLQQQLAADVAVVLTVHR